MGNAADVPRVSLVVPVRDEAASIEALLVSVAAQSRPPDEVIVVDGGSTDDTVARVRGADLPGLPIRVVELASGNPGEARNAGVAAASHPWIAFTDAGLILDPGWLEALAGALGPDTRVVLGGWDPAVRSRLHRWLVWATLPPASRRGPGQPSVVSLLLHRDAFDATGGFPPFRAGEDLVFLDRLSALDEPTALAPAARLTWELPGGWAAVFRRFALFSEHNLRAGLGARWHRGVLRNVAASVALLVLALLHSPWWLAAFPVLAAARALRALLPFREELGAGTGRPDRVLGVALVQAWVDLATLRGALAWLTSGRPRTAA